VINISRFLKIALVLFNQLQINLSLGLFMGNSLENFSSIVIELFLTK